MSEVWRIPPFNVGPKSDPFIAKNNSDLLRAAHKLGHIRPPILDATWGRGKWWAGDWCPYPILGMDKVQAKARHVRGDFRRPPFRPGSIMTIAYDADYKLNGTADQAEGGADEPYGVHEEKPWEQRVGDLCDGIAWWPRCARCAGTGHATHEALQSHLVAAGLLPSEIGAVLARASLRVVPAACPRCAGTGKGPMHGLTTLLAPGGKLLVKCMDQVARYEMRWQTDEVSTRAHEAGLRKVDRLDLPGVPRAQPKGRQQLHARNNASSLLVFERPKA